MSESDEVELNWDHAHDTRNLSYHQKQSLPQLAPNHRINTRRRVLNHENHHNNQDGEFSRRETLILDQKRKPSSTSCALYDSTAHEPGCAINSQIKATVKPETINKSKHHRKTSIAVKTKSNENKENVKQSEINSLAHYTDINIKTGYSGSQTDDEASYYEEEEEDDDDEVKWGMDAFQNNEHELEFSRRETLVIRGPRKRMKTTNEDNYTGYCNSYNFDYKMCSEDEIIDDIDADKKLDDQHETPHLHTIYHKLNDIEIQHKAATIIQKFWKTQKTRLARKLRVEQEFKASIIIQSHYRRLMAMKKYKAILGSVVIIQKYWRRHQSRLLLIRNQSATLIQSFWKMCRCRKTYKRTLKSVKFIQAQWKMILVKRLYQRKRKSAITIQAWIRNYSRSVFECIYIVLAHALILFRRKKQLILAASKEQTSENLHLLDDNISDDTSALKVC